MGFQCLNNRQWIEPKHIKDSDAQGKKTEAYSWWGKRKDTLMPHSKVMKYKEIQCDNFLNFRSKYIFWYWNPAGYDVFVSFHLMCYEVFC